MLRPSTSIAARLIAWTLGACGVVYVASTVSSNALARRMAFAEAEREARSRAEAAAVGVEAVLRSIEDRARLLGEAAAGLDPGSPDLARLLRRFAVESRELYGVAVAFGGGRAAYVQRVADDPEVVTEADLLRERPGYAQSEWYAATLASGAAGWSEPQRAPDGAWLVTFAAPVPGPGGAPRGVLAAEVSVAWLDALVESIHIGRTGFGVILSREGRVLASSRHAGGEGAPGDAPRLVLDEMPPEQRALAEPIVRRMLSGERAFLAVELRGEPYRLAYQPVGRAGWSLGVLYPEAELFEEVHRLRLVQGSLALAGLLLLAVVVVAVSRKITRPVRALAAGADRIAKGELDTELPAAESDDELGALLRAFRHMRDSLQAHIRELRETTAAKERFESELRIAKRIQADMLPKPQAGGPGAGYELAATLVPARAVGGDLFDHFEAGRRVFFLVGDVSGKGVGAALFMARARTVFESVAARQTDPGVILAELNGRLSADNEAGMYVTAILGSLDVTTGELAFAAAGHDPPVLLSAEGSVAPIQTEGGPVVGLLDAVAFPVNRLQLAPGDAVVLYTDGVSEARRADDELFGQERLVAQLRGLARAEARAITDGLLAGVREFALDAPQSDDITILTLRRLGGKER